MNVGMRIPCTGMSLRALHVAAKIVRTKMLFILQVVITIIINRTGCMLLLLSSCFLWYSTCCSRPYVENYSVYQILPLPSTMAIVPPTAVGAVECQLRLKTMLTTVAGLSDEAAQFLCSVDGGGFLSCFD